MHYVKLEVFNITNYKRVSLCNSTATTSTATLICNVPNVTDNSYSYVVSANFTDPQVLFGGFYDFGNATNPFAGADLIPAAGLFVAGVGMAAVLNPIAGITLAGVGVLAAQLMHLIAIPITTIMVIFAVILVLAYKFKT
jgi:uncharacterized membrane-anchored protein YitT (DUF2179 family)